EAGRVARGWGGRYGRPPTPPWVFCTCRSGQALASTSTMIRACPRHYVPPTTIGCFSPNEPAAHPAVVAFPQGSTCLRREMTLQTCSLTLQTCPSSIGVLPGWDCYSTRYSCAVLSLITAVRAGSLRHIAALCNAVLEIIPLRWVIGPIFAARRLRRVGLDRERPTLLRKLRADWTSGLRAIRRRGFSQHGRCGKKQRDEHCENRGSPGVHTLRPPSRAACSVD